MWPVVSDLARNIRYRKYMNTLKLKDCYDRVHYLNLDNVAWIRELKPDEVTGFEEGSGMISFVSSHNILYVGKESMQKIIRFLSGSLTNGIKDI